MTKFELSIHTGYVADWGIVEAIREIFQNALDNEIENPENKMEFKYDENSKKLLISNKTSKLTTDTLLLGRSTKRDSEDTIGQYGEGYKLAFMILLREGKGVKVYNYGAKEIWTTKLVNSRKYNGFTIPTIYVEHNAIWKSVPNNDLTIEISGITKEEYEEVKRKNLNIRDEKVESIYADRCNILLDPEESGNIYVSGLFISNKGGFDCGYNFKPKCIKLDRDRKLIDTIDLSFETSRAWTYAISKSKEDKLKERFEQMLDNEASDIKYINSGYSLYLDVDNTVADIVAKKFIAENGDNSYPVSNNEEYEEVKNVDGINPVIVDSNTKNLIIRSNVN